MYKYFSIDELKCQHCGEHNMDESFMVKIEALRQDLDFPFVVTSAYRCKDHIIERKKKAPGAHSTGHALDIAVSGDQAYRLLREALNVGMTGPLVPLDTMMPVLMGMLGLGAMRSYEKKNSVHRDK
jgi:hypothetical protein